MKSLKPHIGIFGRRNVGKSSLINALSAQEVSIVSEEAGTTTDPVRKYIEIPEIGAVVFIDTAGLDDVGELGEKRILASKKVLDQIDLALLVFSENLWNKEEAELLDLCIRKNIPFLLVHNKADLKNLNTQFEKNLKHKIYDVSSKSSAGIALLIFGIKAKIQDFHKNPVSILGDLVKYGDLVILVTPIDIEAPAGRLIVPQVQTIRDLLDNDCICVVVKERELDLVFSKHNLKPKLVITDSQAFDKVASSIPIGTPLTSFSILFARLKGDFEKLIEGTFHISKLKNNDNVLILESCSHHVSCEDIGRIKIPRWLSNFTGKNLNYEIVAGIDMPKKNIFEYSLVIQCGGCMMTRTQVLNRLKMATNNSIPVTNYGMTIAYVKGIFEKAIKPFNKITSEDYL